MTRDEAAPAAAVPERERWPICKEAPGDRHGPPVITPGRTIPVTCQTHDGARGYCNLRIRKAGGDIVFDPHVTGSCVIVFDETASTALFDLLGEWLG